MFRKIVQLREIFLLMMTKIILLLLIFGSISARLSSLSSSKEIFHEAAQSYKQNPANCGYKEQLTYVKQSVKNQKETKKTQETWFNPPYNKTVKANIGKVFSV